MTDEESDDLLNRLIIELRAKREKESPNERDDFLKAIEAEIDAGKPVPVTLKVDTEKIVPDPLLGRRRVEGTTSGEFIQRQEYRAKEKLDILLRGLALATVAPPLMARTFISELSKVSESAASTTIRFGDDQTADPLLALQKETVDAVVQATSTLKDLLEAIRSDISSDSKPSTPY
ncbi:MAG: hypothetical protein EPO10_25785 [Reyranella sp.]|uniref:hypothetical protein n=1 Tax=Reyranella sp. TaxID=1929291 RepID=UPI00121885F1|nr:hypothetical protein [Reyranella sp.]TAJ84855.1 MAG: hypothetical protein EPO41_28650 [Reyranella sp.]TBR24240.1 MAG: hypothetical protein EPO10_25785 [Reyranella sp.]